MIAQLNEVEKRYGRRDGVRNLSLSLEAGQVVGLLGLNGAGKSTTLKLLAGLLRPTRGRAETFGTAPQMQRAHIAYLSDADNLYGWMTPDDAERFMRGLFPDFQPKRYRELLGFLELPRIPYRSLSKGQRSRLRLAMTLARDARLLLLDEPLSGIDIISREHILGALIREWREDVCVLLSTHEVSEAERLFDRTLFLKDGRLALDSSPEALRAEGRTLVQAFKEVLA